MSRSKVKNLLLLKQINNAVSQIKKGKLDNALETLDKAENSARKAKSTDALYYVLFTRGSILYSAARYDDALETYEKALAAGEELLGSDPENIDYNHYMATTLSNNGNLLKKKIENVKAAECYSRAREIYINLMVSDPKNTVFRSYAGENLNNYGSLLIENSSFKEACTIQKEAIEIYEKLLEESPENPGYQAELSIALSNLGSCLIRDPENVDEESKVRAKQLFEKALSTQKNLLTQQPENEKIKEDADRIQKTLEGL